MLAEISGGLTKIQTQYFGRGPTQTKSYLLNDTVVCILQGGFTRVERTLIDEQRPEAVHDIRRAFQKAIEERFTDVVETASGRRVIAYMSQVHVDPDLAVEFFMLEPSADGSDVLGQHVHTPDE
jgi:uncharacterized protein YbcI